LDALLDAEISVVETKFTELEIPFLKE